MPIAFIHPSVTESQNTCDFTVCSTAFEIIDKHSIYLCVNILLMGGIYRGGLWVPLDIRVRNARHPVVFVMPPPLGAGGIMFSGCPSVRPSVRPKPEIPSFDLYMGPPDQP